MSKRFTKIICVSASVIAALGIASAAGCSGYYNASALDGNYSAGKVVSNGGFAVEKGEYVYFLNGVEQNTADNTFGTPEKGGVYRISKTDLGKNNYASAQRVVPQIAYTSNYDTGIFIYGDYIYYGTPSTAKNSEGDVQNSNLDMKRTKLDGTETMRDPYVSFPDTTYNYRFVEEKGVVYLMYVATSETLFEESSGVTNLHSYNTQTNEDTLLAYDVGTVLFDAENKENPRVYYTMDVYDYSTAKDFGYNQLYTVTASATENKFEDLSSETVSGWNDETDRYVNCGELVLDGIGSVGTSKSPFNKDDKTNELSYTYTPAKYVNNTLFYTRKTATNSGEYLFSIKDDSTAHPVDANPAADARILSDGTNASKYEYLFKDGELYAAIHAEGAGGISINRAVKGKLQPAADLDDSDDYFRIVKDGTATLLFTDIENNWLYYSVTGGNGYTINRVDYSGEIADYIPLPTGETDFTAVKVLDLDSDSAWFKPEIIDGYLLFASETTNMTTFNYVMVFDMHGADGIMTNGEIRKLNELYKGIDDIINNTYGDADKYPAAKYANLQNALKYASYSGDYEYLQELAEAANSKLEEDEDPVYSEVTLAEYEKFLKPEADGVWGDYTAEKTVNGKKVYANTREYYYSVLGVMTEKDAESYMDGLKTSYLVAYPQDETVGWYEGLSDAGKIGFICGMVAAGLVVIAGVTVLTIFLVRRNKKDAPEIRKKKIKVDTTDDKNIDVYSQD